MTAYKSFFKIVSIFVLFTFMSCQDKESSFGDIYPPSNLQITASIVGQDSSNPNGDGTGIVNFTAVADNAISYKYIFSDNTNYNAPSGILQKRFNQNGLHSYNVTVVASGKGGVSTSKTISVEVLSNYQDAQSVQFLTGGTHKNWYWSASELGHLAVGPNSADATQNYFGYYYMAAPWEKAASADSSCLYNNVLTFTLNGNQLQYELNNNGSTFFNSNYESVAGGSAGYDHCYSYNASGVKTVTLSPSESLVMANPDHLTQTTGTVMNFSDNGFMGYYLGNSSYEIMSITANRMVVRVLQGNNSGLAWYHIFTTIPPVQDPITDYTNLVWSDEFNVDGAPDSSKWGYDIGTGSGGWGNGEAQYYTNSSNNVIVQGGNLLITAKAQSFNGSNYTSARLKSQGNFQFKYGKVEVRAKLPGGAGTWPAIWMLGSNISTVSWPNCGEIDIMEEMGNNPDVIHATLHYPGFSGSNGVTNSATFLGATSGFKVYKAIWTPNSIKFYVDGVLYHTFINNNSVPFNQDFFLLLNLAMGGNFGGNIDPAFSQATMQVDYVRVYQ